MKKFHHWSADAIKLNSTHAPNSIDDCETMKRMLFSRSFLPSFIRSNDRTSTWKGRSFNNNTEHQALKYYLFIMLDLSIFQLD